jgi:hypothetical protein
MFDPKVSAFDVLAIFLNLPATTRNLRQKWRKKAALLGFKRYLS